MGGTGDRAELFQHAPGQGVPALSPSQPGPQLLLPPLLLGFCTTFNGGAWFSFCNVFTSKNNPIDFTPVKNGVDPEAFKV